MDGGCRGTSVMTAVKVRPGGKVRESRESTSLTDPEQEAREMDLSLREGPSRQVLQHARTRSKERTADRGGGRGLGSEFRKDGTRGARYNYSISGVREERGEE